MQHTTNLNLNKPDDGDGFDVDHFNDNADILDDAIKGLRDSVSQVVFDGVGALNLTRTPSGTCCLDFVVGSSKYRLQWRNDGISYATFINGAWTTIWSK